MTRHSTYYPGLDILKFALAVMIVALHCELFVELPREHYQMVQIVWTYAVPTFFAISAFLFTGRINEPGILGHSLKRMAIVFGLWYIILFPRTYLGFLQYANYKEIIYAVVMTSCASGFWFVKALFYNTVILYLCLKAPKWVFYAVGVCAMALFLWLDVLDVILHSFPLNFQAYFSFYYHTGVFFVGAFCFRFRNCFLFNRVPKWVIVLAIVVILMLCRSFGMYIVMKLFMPVLLIAIFINVNVANINSCKRLRAMSIMIFIMQFAILSIYTGIGNRLFANDAATHAIYECSIIKFSVVISILVLISWTITQLEHRYKFLKYLH